MSEERPDYSRPERILLLLASGNGEHRGKAVRLADASELRFESMDDLVAWLRDPSARPREVEP